ncbi:hypothetical protein CIK06_25555 [Plantactinospora sp. KBS50]|nr:hypothetical protein CIK06_25555 [Plantactinospora sp. KBS50]
MQRLAGKFALLLAGIYVLFPFGMAVSTAAGEPIPLWGWPLLLLPAFLFAPAVIAAIRLHRTSDRDIGKRLWWRSLLLACTGFVLVIAVALILGEANS